MARPRLRRWAIRRLVSSFLSVGVHVALSASTARI
jgi:hypothetical protein